jgi:hypothetical protein
MKNCGWLATSFGPTSVSSSWTIRGIEPDEMQRARLRFDARRWGLERGALKDLWRQANAPYAGSDDVPIVTEIHYKWQEPPEAADTMK